MQYLNFLKNHRPGTIWHLTWRQTQQYKLGVEHGIAVKYIFFL